MEGNKMAQRNIKKTHILFSLLALTLLAIGLATFQLTRIKSAKALPAQPNILVVMSDDQGCDQHYTTHCDQIKHMMKFLDSEPGGHWITSMQTRAHGSLCCPNRVSTLTGQTNAHNGQWANGGQNINESETLATAVKRAGYSTGLFGKYINGYKGPRVPQGWSRWIAHNDSPAYYNFDVWDNGSTGSNSATKYKVPKVDNETYEAYWLSNKVNQWVNEQSAQNKPWMAFFTSFAPHTPGGSATDVVPSTQSTKPKVLPNAKEGCLGGVDPSIADKPSFVQAQKCVAGNRKAGVKAQISLNNAFKRVYDNLVANGQLDNTIIIYMGDNGMALGSHRNGGKQCAYEECHTIPLMMRIPGHASGTLSRMISNIDIMPTILEWTGATTTLQMDGKSFVQLLNGNQSGWREEQYLHNGIPNNPFPDDYDTVRDDCIVRDPCMIYTEYVNGEREIYNLTSDPFQLTNLLPNPITGYAGQPGWDDNHPQVIRMKQSLAAHKASGN
jgi:N-acetylglucosamine-6-sulfatase